MKSTLVWAGFPLLVAGCVAPGAEEVPVRLSTAAHSAQVRRLEDGSFEVRTTGGDPYVVCERVTEDFDHDRLHVFAFEYRCPESLEFFEIFFGNPFSGHNRFGSGPVPAAPDWRPFAADLAAVPGTDWGPGVRDFRIDFGDRGGRTVQVRSVRVRAPTAEERQAAEERRAAEAEALRTLQGQVDKRLIAPARIPPFENVLAATHRFEDAGGQTLVSVVGKDLDLATQVSAAAGAVPPPVPLPPALAAGEGESPKNHTIVRVLNRYGLCEVQFLAYPEFVRGGVAVAAGRMAGGQTCLVTAPLTDSAVRELRLFGRYGGALGSIPVAADLSPPFAMAVGAFLPGAAGDQAAVAPRKPAPGPVPVLLYSLNGKELARLPVAVPPGPGDTLSLATAGGKPGEPARLVVYRAGAGGFCLVDFAQGTVETREAGLPPECTGVFASASDRFPLAAVCSEPLYSGLWRIPPAGAPVRQDVGSRENRFWFTPGGPYDATPEGRHVRRSRFAHLRTDFATPAAREPDFSRTDPAFWAGEPFAAWVAQQLGGYDTEPPTCWEPCFTHRWFYGPARPWAEAVDPETGLPSYTLVTRENQTGTYGEFGETRSFVSGTYAPGVAPIECLYTYPLRAFLHELARRFRTNPEHFVAVEPNHEMEINAESETTHGDYNPNMIRAFYRYLVSLYGPLDTINRLFGTPFASDRFDAPRNLQRGPWDAYAVENPYYRVWMRFLNYVVYRVVAGTYREALLAGFPPETIKCHQIPDLYAVASLTAFSRPAQRVTPIDWNLNAGVGFGCTRYGVWYNQEYNCIQGPHSSGFDAMVVGEYQSLTPDAEAAFQQLVYMQGHGVQFIHCMVWPAGHDRGYNRSLAEALRRLAEADMPRPGQTGGTGQVRPVRLDGCRYDIVSLGTSRDRTGLLKSVREDGAWEGSVYVVPFHAHVEVRPLLSGDRLELGPETLRLGPFPGVDAGNLIEIAFAARALEPGTEAASLRVFHHGIELPEQTLVCRLTPDWQQVRLLVRVQIDTDDVALELGPGEPRRGTWGQGRAALRDFRATLHSERTTRLKKGVFSGERHEGGVTFDVLPQGV